MLYLWGKFLRNEVCKSGPEIGVKKKMQETIEKTQEMICHLEAVNQILAKNHNDASRMIPILQEIQEMDKYLSRDVISYVATALDVPVAQVYGVATFYAHFTLNPKGKHIIRLCDGTACHVKKSHGILDMLYTKLNLTEEKITTDDQMFTLEVVSCLGMCGFAPVVVIDEVSYAPSTPERVEALVDEIIAKEKAGN